MTLYKKGQRLSHPSGVDERVSDAENEDRSDTQALAVTFVVVVDLNALTWTYEDPKDAQMLVDTAIAVVGGLIVYSTIQRTADGGEIRVRKLTPREVRNLTTEWGTPFEKKNPNKVGQLMQISM